MLRNKEFHESKPIWNGILLILVVSSLPYGIFACLRLSIHRGCYCHYCRRRRRRRHCRRHCYSVFGICYSWCIFSFLFRCDWRRYGWKIHIWNFSIFLIVFVFLERTLCLFAAKLQKYTIEIYYQWLRVLYATHTNVSYGCTVYVYASRVLSMMTFAYTSLHV